MKTLLAFTKKEFLEQVRTGKLLLLVIIACLFGIMNPLIAKITPWLMEMMAGQLSEVGMQVSEVKIDALTSWTQFYKNVPMLLIIFVLIFSSILTNEYQKGTLVNILTKGLSRWKVIIAKVISMISVWTICYWLCLIITYSYNCYFWDNSIAINPILAAMFFYVLGIWILTLIILMSSFFNNSSAVLTMVTVSMIVIYILSFLPKLQNYLPTQLFNSMNMLTGLTTISDYIPALFITIILTFISILLSITFFNKKNI